MVGKRTHPMLEILEENCYPESLENQLRNEQYQTYSRFHTGGV
jgi:hypothetical protein